MTVGIIETVENDSRGDRNNTWQGKEDKKLYKNRQKHSSNNSTELRKQQK